MRFLSLCSGIEAASVAWEPLGWSCAAIAEIKAFPCALLRHYWPGVPNLGDVSKVTESQVRALGPVDVVVFGFPCQDVSVAGQRKGLHANGTPTRSGLFFACARIAEWSGARWVVAENVPGLFSSHEGRDFGAVVGELAGAGFGVPGDGWRNSGVALGPKGLVEWATLDAQYWNLAQRRERVFIVRDAGDWSNRPPLFLNAESLRWNPPPSRQARERVAPTVEGRAGRSGCNNFATSGGLQEVASAIRANSIGSGRAGDSRGQDCVIPESGPYNLQSFNSCAMKGNGRAQAANRTEIARAIDASGLRAQQGGTVIAHTLSAEGHDASEDGTGRGVPLVSQCISSRNERYDAESQDFVPVAFDMRGREGGAQFEGPHDTANVRASSGGSSRSYVAGMAVRRLTPREVERLMGFPDDYTLIPYRGKPACDGPRYRALGNSMAVPVMSWLGRRIALVASL
jgi:DNA (cytosine-5)-methyltransferase 1